MPFSKSSAVLYAMAALVGVAAGVGAILFDYLSGFVGWLVLEVWVGYHAPGPAGEVLHFGGHGSAREILVVGLIFAPAVGCAAANLLCRTFASEASGHGTDAVIHAYHHRGGRVRARVPIVKAIATALCLGSGGSGGREGPIAQIGAGIGSVLGSTFRLRPRYRRILMAAGMGAGVGSIFRAPLAGALFSAEILYRDAELESEVVIPSFISSSVAYCVFCSWMGDFGRLFELEGVYGFRDPLELLPYTLLALTLVPTVVVYARSFYGMERLFRAIPGPRPLVAAFGGLLTGCLGVGLWFLLDDEGGLALLGYGYGVLQEAMVGEIVGWEGARLLLLVGLLKIVSTGCTISAGGSGGVFGPSMVIGGGIGGAIGIAAHQVGWVENPGCFVIVGMTGFFAGAAKTPISTIIMVSEMTGSYELLLPAMWVCCITFLLTPRTTIYSSQAQNRADSPAHRGEFQVALLEEMRVSDIPVSAEDLHTVRYDMPLSQVVREIADSESDYFPVVDAEGRFVGIFSAHDVRAFTYDESVHRLAIAADLMTTSPIVLTPDEDLHAAVAKFNTKKLDQLPVVDAEDPSILLGMLRHREIGRAYARRLAGLEKLRDRRRDGWV